jgi:hypothetical protein
MLDIIQKQTLFISFLFMVDISAVLQLFSSGSGSVVFGDGFEGGSLGKWDGSASASVVASSVYNGSYAAKATGSNSYWYKDLGSSYNDLYFASYIIHIFFKKERITIL